MSVVPIGPNNRFLESVDKARQVLNTIESVPEVMDIADRAEVAKVYARNVLKSKDAQNHAAKIAIECQRRAGELIKQIAAPAHRPNNGSTLLPLRELGVSKIQSSRWQKAAAVPEDLVDRYFDETESAGDDITNSGLLRYHRDQQAAVRKVEKRQSEDRARDEADETVPNILRGRFQDVLGDIPDGSVDLIVTDPPYGPNYNHAYADLAEWAARKLKPGGSCIAYSGQSNLPDVLTAMSGHLRYWWTLALMHNHGGQQLPGKWVYVEWKPLVWFVKDSRNSKTYVADRMSGSKPRKDLHEWAQGVDEVCYLIEQLSEPGDLIVDPFAGSGSFGYAALSMGRKFIGAESGDHEDAR
jgi:16S rRNA G966 N2-methylase RsmD